MENIIESPIRNLRRDEIECRINSITSKGVTLLLYKTARTDIRILDETYGQMNWQCEYREIKESIFCGISIYDAQKTQWVTKWDCGEEREFGFKAKSAASDSFKRAGFKWGIGIELYTAPFIFIPSSKCTITNGKCYDKFEIEKISTRNKTIYDVSIVNRTNNTRCFVWQRVRSKTND